MKKTVPVIISAVIATMLFMIGLSVVKNVSSKNNNQDPKSTSTVAQFSAREQQYQQLIADANVKISLANQQIENLSQQLIEQSTDSTSTYLFNAEQAAVLAENISGVPPQSLPELVNFNEKPAYEVVFSNGKIYIDANKGGVLFNGLQSEPVEISPEDAITIAVRYLGRTDVVSFSVGPFQGANVYIVGFSDGTLVYVNASGKVVAIQVAQQNSTSSSQEEIEEEDEDEHEDD